LSALLEYALFFGGVRHDNALYSYKYSFKHRRYLIGYKYIQYELLS
jgi:hypothetical protein